MFLAGFHFFFCGKNSWLLTHGFSSETEHQKPRPYHEGLVEMILPGCKTSDLKDFLNFHSYLGKMSNLTVIFQMGWFKHQPEKMEPALSG